MYPTIFVFFPKRSHEGRVFLKKNHMDQNYPIGVEITIFLFFCCFSVILIVFLFLFLILNNRLATIRKYRTTCSTLEDAKNLLFRSPYFFYIAATNGLRSSEGRHFFLSFPMVICLQNSQKYILFPVFSPDKL